MLTSCSTFNYSCGISITGEIENVTYNDILTNEYTYNNYAIKFSCNNEIYLIEI